MVFRNCYLPLLFFNTHIYLQNGTNMLLVIDVGNSNNVIGLFSGEKLLTHWRIRTEWNRTADEYWVLIKEFILLNNVETETIDDIIIACVVPPLVPILQGMSKKYFSCEPLIVGPGIKTGISILYRNPSEVGADRIVNSVAAFEKYGGPLIIVDFGTATTFDVVSGKGEYLGGAIFPGIQISLEALFKSAAKLPRVDMTFPEQVIGKSTVESLRSGAVYGFSGMVEALVKQIKSELGQDAKVVATGGIVDWITTKTTVIDIQDPFLTLDGLRIIYEKNQ
jgi:type III pantothenate kinase